MCVCVCEREREREREREHVSIEDIETDVMEDRHKQNCRFAHMRPHVKILMYTHTVKT